MIDIAQNASITIPSPSKDSAQGVTITTSWLKTDNVSVKKSWSAAFVKTDFEKSTRNVMLGPMKILDASIAKFKKATFVT